jgi:hypothetical protein
LFELPEAGLLHRDEVRPHGQLRDRVVAGLGGLSLNYGAPTYWTWDTVSTAGLISGTDFKIRIRSDTDPTIYDESDNYFSLTNSLPSPATCNDLKI